MWKAVYANRPIHIIMIVYTSGSYKISIPSLQNIVVIDNLVLCFKFSQQPYHRYAYQWLDKVKIKKENMQSMIQIYHVVQEI